VKGAKQVKVWLWMKLSGGDIGSWLRGYGTRPDFPAMACAGVRHAGMHSRLHASDNGFYNALTALNISNDEAEHLQGD
jgi:hypothetical protein